MSYLVFARKYRPQTFDQVVQQDHVTRTLSNAIAAGRVSHAILFTGPRGTGKTTIARILAKAMNCAEGPGATPCNSCQSCQEITGGHAADVFEIDGASNNSVDQIRELRENLKYMPAHSRFKIYIIDEVHMLSLAAFNALLKTLEEPPDHVMFIFATTEVHKIPVTILSRCQRHDLRRIDMSAIIDWMRTICDREKVQIDDAGLALVAQEAGGSMRDALSLLDHVLACTQEGVTAELVAELLGAAERRHLFDLSAAVFKRDIRKVLATIDEVWRHGLEMRRFYSDLVSHFHNLSVLNIGQDAHQLVDLPAHEIRQLAEQAKEVSGSYMLQVLEMLFQAETSIRMSSQPKLALEMIFLKLFQTPPVLPIETLIDKLDQLRKTAPIDRKLQAAPEAIVPNVNPASASPAEESPAPENPPPVNTIQESEALPPESEVYEGNASAKMPPVDGLWDQVVNQVEEERPSLAAFLKKCQPSASVPGHLDIAVGGNQFTFNSVKKHLDFVESICSAISGQPVKIDLSSNGEDEAEKQKARESADRLKKKALSHPLVMESLELFNGKIVDVKVS